MRCLSVEPTWLVHRNPPPRQQGLERALDAALPDVQPGHGLTHRQEHDVCLRVLVQTAQLNQQGTSVWLQRFPSQAPCLVCV